MPLHIVEWENIRSYDLFHTNGERNRDSFVGDLKALLWLEGLYVEEAVVVYRSVQPGNKVDEYLRSMNLISEHTAPLEVVFLPVHKTPKIDQSKGSHAACRVDFAIRSARYVGDVAAEYISGGERVMYKHQDGIRKGDGLIVYGPTLRGELLEALGKLNTVPTELQRPGRLIKTVS
ncbi:MAG: hypothetical protein HY515_01505 [Candidatus Aenigmarchaeota archaeon]|nr:hypothetical protein [Candidatus Aenigmarchaeota archaeon]